MGHAEMEPDRGSRTLLAEPPAPPVEPPAEDGDAGRGDSRWVTVASFGHPIEAHLARLKLEAEGIDCFLDNELLLATDWLYSNATGGVKLQVPLEDAERARRVLEEARRMSAPAEPAADVAESYEPRCPKCGSDRVYLSRFSRRVVFLTLLLLGFPLPLLMKCWRCPDCRHEWWPGRKGFPVIMNPEPGLKDKAIG